MEEAEHARFLRWRGIEDPCQTCTGAGIRSYANTATWRGGIGGASITSDVCDACWGSGDRYRTGCDLRRLRDEERQRIAEAAVEALARSCGATLSSTRMEIRQIVTLLRKAAKKRGVDGIFFSPLCEGLADQLERALKV